VLKPSALVLRRRLDDLEDVASHPVLATAPTADLEGLEPPSRLGVGDEVARPLVGDLEGCLDARARPSRANPIAVVGL
jgi:hypothetical protein